VKVKLTAGGPTVAPDDEMPSPEAWEPVSVPGRPTQFAGAEAVAYETTVPNRAEGHAVLVLRGAYAHARV